MKKLNLCLIALILDISAYAKETIQIVTTHEPPLQIEVKGQQLTGVSVEIMRLLLKEIGYEKTKINFNSMFPNNSFVSVGRMCGYSF